MMSPRTPSVAGDWDSLEFRDGDVREVPLVRLARGSPEFDMGGSLKGENHGKHGFEIFQKLGLR